MSERVLVIGGSAAGARAAEAVRKHGFAGEIVVVSDDPDAPYYRPALSKQILAGKGEVTAFRQPVKDSLDVGWRHARAVALDAAARTFTLDDGTRLDCSAAVLAGGCRPRLLPDVEYGDRVVPVHRAADVRRLRDQLHPGSHLVIVGAGLIGSEIAGTAGASGAKVTLVDPSSAPLRRALGPLGDVACMGWHRARGIEMRLGVGVTGVIDGDRPLVQLSTGGVVDADIVVVSTGVVPDTEWLRDSGVPLDGHGAVLCDATLTVQGLPWLAAAGDLASWTSGRRGGQARVEHWFTAMEQGLAAGANLLRPTAERVSFDAMPFFWTEQHGYLVHAVGRHTEDSEWAVLEHSGSAAFVAGARTEGELSGVLLVDSAHRLAHYRGMLNQPRAA